MSNLPDFLIIPSQILLDKNLQPLDGYVYGLVYWFSRLKLEKCIASNKELADRLGASASGVANSLSRLNKYGYINVVLDQYNQRKEIIPNVSYVKVNIEEPLLNRVTPHTQTSNPHYSNDEHNNKTYKEDLIILKEKEEKESTDIAIASPSPLKKTVPYKEIEDVKSEDLEYISDHYQVPLTFVQSKYEDMVLWAGQLPYSKKIQNRNWRLTLMNWVKRDAIKLRKEATYGSKRAIDARGIR